MFDKLIVSSKSQGRRRTLGFVLGTSAAYLILLASALALSIFTIAPRLADYAGPKRILPLAAPRAGTHERVAQGRAPQSAARPDIYNPMKLSKILAIDSDARKPVSWSAGPPVAGAVTGGPAGGGFGSGVPGAIDGFPGSHGEGDGSERGDAPPPPPPQRAAEKPPERASRAPLKVASTVLQGKAIERRTPAYPAMARQIRLEGSVAVEIVISPEGRVESWRAISGHPLLVPSAVEAARQWRFAPTLLNGTPVRVTGIITFVFRL